MDLEEIGIRDPGGGVNQSGIRDHNERLVLSMIQRHGQLPGMNIAKRAGLSPQTVSVILRSLEQDGLLVRGATVGGRVGKPSVPMALNPDGAFSVGLKIGRRSLEILLVDFVGNIRQQQQKTYKYPAPENIFAALSDGLQSFHDTLGPARFKRVAGIGVAWPSQLWIWHEQFGVERAEIARWREIDLKYEIAKFTDLPVFVENDATAACRAEHVFGLGRELQDFAYFFLGSFVGGGVVLNHSVYPGRSGNAGSFGSLPTNSPDRRNAQLIDNASIQQLEEKLVQSGIDASPIWQQPQDWSGFPRELDAWTEHTASHLARAIISICSVIDFEAVILDGAIPTDIRAEIVSLVSQKILHEDSRGILLPNIKQGTVGPNAAAVGAACGPIFAQFLLDTISGRL